MITVIVIYFVIFFLLSTLQSPTHFIPYYFFNFIYFLSGHHKRFQIKKIFLKWFQIIQEKKIRKNATDNFFKKILLRRMKKMKKRRNNNDDQRIFITGNLMFNSDILYRKIKNLSILVLFSSFFSRYLKVKFTCEF